MFDFDALVQHQCAVEAAANAAIGVIAEWMQEAGLDLAGHKTEAVLITSRKKVEFMSVQVGNNTIRSMESIKYLGVLLDNRLSFRAHVDYVVQKASRMQGALSRMLPNIGGPKRRSGQRWWRATSVFGGNSQHRTGSALCESYPVSGQCHMTQPWYWYDSSGYPGYGDAGDLPSTSGDGQRRTSGRD
ncbi:hypothetical protein ACLKA7_001816 [Drosophila subpalustris]